MKISKPNRLASSLTAGFLLAEVLVGIAIFGFVTLALYAGMTYCLTTSDTIRKNQRATQIMLQTFELVRLYDWDQITTPGFLPTTIFADDTALWTTPSTNVAMYSGTVENIPATSSSTRPMTESYADDLRLITINLTWTGGGLVRTRTMNTLVARQGLQNYVY